MVMATTSVYEKPRGDEAKDSESANTATVLNLADETIEPPDGGLRAWMSVAGG